MQAVSAFGLELWLSQYLILLPTYSCSHALLQLVTLFLHEEIVAGCSTLLNCLTAKTVVFCIMGIIVSIPQIDGFTTDLSLSSATPSTSYAFDPTKSSAFAVSTALFNQSSESSQSSLW